MRGPEYLGFGASKAVNALLGVAHNENAGRRGADAAAAATARARVAAEPGSQRLPLQGVGVLELVNQQMFDAGVQALLHPARQHRVAQHHLGRALHVVHINPATLTFEGRKLLEQHAGKPGHAPLINPGRMLQARRRHAQHQVLRVTHPLDADELFAKFSRRALFGQQCGQDGRHVALRKRHFKLHAFG